MKILGQILLLTVTSLCQDLDFDFNFEDFFRDNIEQVPAYTLRSSDAIYSNQLYATDFLRELNNELRQWKHSTSLADWEYKTNITDHNMKHKLELGSRFDKWWQRRLKEARKFDVARLPEHLSRQLSLITMPSFSENNKLAERKSYLISKMEGLYGSTRACLRNTSCLPLEPDLVNIMAKSRDPETLKDVWVSWRDSLGPQIRDYYEEFIQASNEEALENGYPNFSHMWKQSLFYQTPELDSMLRHLWRDLKPLYLQLHAYVRRKLRERYGSDVVGNDGTIPAHLLGNMWAQHWTNILDLVVPYPEDDQQTKIEAKLKANLDVQGLFHLADNFYTSIGLYPMTPTFWSKSMFKKPTDRDVLCHASAFDMYYPGDFRIKMCAEVSLESFRTVHHEMGHVQYYMAYADQPTIYREGANPAFHEAVGDTVQLSVLSHSHLKGLGFYHEDDDDGGRDDDDDDELLWEGSHKARHRYKRTSKKEKSKINFLLNMALEKLAFIPFGLLVDVWRWDVMKGEITPDNYNSKWWEMRLQYQGIRSPVPRSEKNFDPGAKYHITSNTPYISYFLSYFQQFQMFKALCDISGFVGPLHECDFYGSRDAGNKLKRMLTQGSSIPWQDQLDYLTGSRQVTADAILQYFQPLHDWLVHYNTLHTEDTGWDNAQINWSDH